MKKFLINLLLISVILVCLSVAYYFAIFLPNQKVEEQKTMEKIYNEIKNSRSKDEDTSYIKNQLEELNSAQQRQEEEFNNELQRQQRDRQMQIDCESSNGVYGGNGLCTYY